MEIKGEWFDLADQELLEKIGHALLAPDTKAVFPPSFEAKIAAAQKWLAERKAALCNLICADPRIKVMLRNNSLGKELTILVIDILEHNFLKISPVPPIATGILFCRYAYYEFCDVHPD